MFKILKNLVQKKESNTDNDIKPVAKCPKCGLTVIEHNEYWGCVGRLSKSCDFKIKNTYKGEKLDISMLNDFQKMEQFTYIYGILHGKAQDEKERRKNAVLRDGVDLNVTCKKCLHEMYRVGKTAKCSNEKCGFEISTTYKGITFSDEQMKDLLNRRVSEEYVFEDGSKGRVLINQDTKHEFISEYVFFSNVKELKKEYFTYYSVPTSINKKFTSIKYLIND